MIGQMLLGSDWSILIFIPGQTDQRHLGGALHAAAVNLLWVDLVFVHEGHHPLPLRGSEPSNVTKCVSLNVQLISED